MLGRWKWEAEGGEDGGLDSPSLKALQAYLAGYLRYVVPSCR